jgi:hypothetical protein
MDSIVVPGNDLDLYTMFFFCLSIVGNIGQRSNDAVAAKGCILKLPVLGRYRGRCLVVVVGHYSPVVMDLVRHGRVHVTPLQGLVQGLGGWRSGYAPVQKGHMAKP